MGIAHGTYCVGCCWALMGVLFAVGIMNLLRIAAIAAFVLIEKAAPFGIWTRRGAGALLVAWGVVTLAIEAAVMSFNSDPWRPAVRRPATVAALPPGGGP